MQDSNRGNGGAPSPETLVLFGIPIHNMTQEEVLAWVVDRARSKRPGQIVTANTDFALQAWRDPEMHRIQLEADLIVADGMPLVWLSRLFGPALKERVAGSDLVPRLAEVARDHGLTLQAVGGAPGVAQKVMSLLQVRYPGLRVSGCESPPKNPLLRMDHDALVGRIRSRQPDIVLVAFGAPKQEKWINMHVHELGTPVAIGVGASLDFLAGTHHRAPRWIQKIGLEWFWRMASEPRRLFKRYYQDFAFLAGMLAHILWLRVKPVWGRDAERPDPTRIESRGATLGEFRPLATAADAEACFKQFEPAAQRGSLVLDLSGIRWLNSLELGTLVRLGGTCRQGNFRLILSAVHPRVRDLIHLFQLQRYLEIAPTSENLERRLERLGLMTKEDTTVQLTRAGRRLLVELPEEFSRDVVSPAREDFIREWKEGAIREVVIDASETTYLDSAGTHFISQAGRVVNQHDRSLWLRGFPEDVLSNMRRDGLEGIKIDRRNRFREGAPAKDGRPSGRFLRPVKKPGSPPEKARVR